MQHLFMVFRAWAGLSYWPLWRRSRQVLVWLGSLFCALWVIGCGSTLPATAQRPIPPDRVHGLCWNPAEIGSKREQFVFANDGTAISQNEPGFWIEVARGGFVFKYVEDAPVKNLRLVPLSRPEAWCTNVPRPTDPKVLRLLDPCAEPISADEGRAATKNLLGQVSTPSPIFCEKRPHMAPTTQDTILLRSRNIAFLTARKYNRAVAEALTQANADIERVTNESKWSLKRLLLEDPGTLEQIQQRVADKLNSIEPPPEFTDPYLEPIVLAGFQAGFEDGKFAVEAKLFAIDVGVFVIEAALMELALGPLGGAKLLTSAVSKGTKAMKAAFVRLGDIPIFIPGAANGLGGFMRARHVLKALSRFHSRRLEAAMFEEAKLLKKPLEKLATDETHHIVAHGSEKAKRAREILEKFGIDIDNPANGVFLPGSKSAPNPKGSIVHATLANKKAYYDTVQAFLEKATSQADAIRRLRKLGELLENGTFFNVTL